MTRFLFFPMKATEDDRSCVWDVQQRCFHFLRAGDIIESVFPNEHPVIAFSKEGKPTKRKIDCFLNPLLDQKRVYLVQQIGSTYHAYLNPDQKGVRIFVDSGWYASHLFQLLDQLGIDAQEAIQTETYEAEFQEKVLKTMTYKKVKSYWLHPRLFWQPTPLRSASPDTDRRYLLHQNKKGKAIYHSEGSSKAAPYFRECLSLDPSHWESHLYLLSCLRNLVELEESLDIIARFLERIPKQETLMRYLALVHGVEIAWTNFELDLAATYLEAAKRLQSQIKSAIQPEQILTIKYHELCVKIRNIQLREKNYESLLPFCQEVRQHATDLSSAYFHHAFNSFITLITNNVEQLDAALHWVSLPVGPSTKTERETLDRFPISSLHSDPDIELNHNVITVPTFFDDNDLHLIALGKNNQVEHELTPQAIYYGVQDDLVGQFKTTYELNQLHRTPQIGNKKRWIETSYQCANILHRIYHEGSQDARDYLSRHYNLTKESERDFLYDGLLQAHTSGERVFKWEILRRFGSADQVFRTE